MNNNGSSPRWWRYACAGLKLEWKPFHIFHRWNICVNHLYLLRVTQFSNIRQNEATSNDFHLKHKWQMQMLCNISEEFEGPHGHDTLEKCYLHVNYALKRFLVNTPWRCSWKLTLGKGLVSGESATKCRCCAKVFSRRKSLKVHMVTTQIILLLLLVFFYLSLIFRKCTFCMSQERQIIIHMIFAILKIVCILYVRFGTALSRVVLQLHWLFAGVVALLAGKRFLAGVWKHVILQTTGATGREAALLTYKWQCGWACGSWE